MGEVIDSHAYDKYLFTFKSKVMMIILKYGRPSQPEED